MPSGVILTFAGFRSRWTIGPVNEPLGPPFGFMFQLAGIETLNSLPPTSWPYVAVFPPPETTPLLTDSCEAGTPS